MTTEMILKLQQQNRDLRSIIQQNKAAAKQCQCSNRQKEQDKQIRIFNVKQQTYKHEINLLKDSLKDIDQSYQLLNQQYQNQRIRIKNFEECQFSLQNEIQELRNQKQGLQKKYRINEQQILQKFNKKLQQNQEDCERKITQYEIRISQIQQKLQKKTEIHEKTLIEHKKIKQLLTMQTKKRKEKQKQLTQEIQALQKNLKTSKQMQNKLKRKVNQKIALIIQKDGIIKDLEKTMREMNNRVLKIQKQADRKIFYEKSLTKKAMDGLEMVRKYSALQMNKSKQKQKIYLKDKKELISKIKQMSVKQSHGEINDESFISAVSSRKTSLPLYSSKSNNSFVLGKKKNSLKLTNKIFKETQQKALKQTKQLSTTAKALSKCSSSINYRDRNSYCSKQQKEFEDYHKYSPDISNFVLQEQCSDISQDSAFIVAPQSDNHTTKKTCQQENKLSASKSTPKLQIKNCQIPISNNIHSLTCAGNTSGTPCFESNAVARVQHGHKINMFKASK